MSMDDFDTEDTAKANGWYDDNDQDCDFCNRIHDKYELKRLRGGRYICEDCLISMKEYEADNRYDMMKDDKHG